MRLGPRYEGFSYIEPCRTEVARTVDSLAAYEAAGWWAQFKKNGSRSVIFIPPDRQPFFLDHRGARQPAGWNRHHEPHRSWQFDALTWESFRTIRGNRWCVIDGELVHHKTPHIKFVHYLYDVLVWDGCRLTGTTYAERYGLLWELFAPRLAASSSRSPRRRSGRLSPDQITPSHIRLDPTTWLARNHQENLRDLFLSLNAPEDEGLVLKDPRGIYRGTKADHWMAKVRKVDSLTTSVI